MYLDVVRLKSLADANTVHVSPQPQIYSNHP